MRPFTNLPDIETMGKSFVYNTGAPETGNVQEILDLNFGLFMDGTPNNQTNTGLRLQQEEKHPEKDHFSAPEQNSWLHFFVAPQQSSYHNDLTNIARMWQWCRSDYRIYIEGAGTVTGGADDPEGYLFGSGATGIRAKVREACERLAKAVLNARRQAANRNKRTGTLTIDVFGFSRGAAAARNFLHEVNVRRAYQAVRRPGCPTGIPALCVPAATAPLSQNNGLFYDADGMPVDMACLRKNMLPKMGHFGYALLLGGMPDKELNSLRLVVRFVGLYDTVTASLNPGAEGIYCCQNTSVLASASQYLHSGLDHDAPALNLNEIGPVVKLVHLTAADEHRKNFALKRIAAHPAAVERLLPGSHSDIGGGYENAVEEQELESSLHFPNGYLDELGAGLIESGWFRPEQLRIENGIRNKWSAGVLPRSVWSRRFVRKEYSYLALHLMQAYCSAHLRGVLLNDLSTVYSLHGHPVLEAFNAQLRSELNDVHHHQVISNIFSKVLQADKSTSKSRHLPDRIYTPLHLETVAGSSSQPADASARLPASLSLLHRLRNEYLHWPACWSAWGMEPEAGRIRSIT
ncbi:hypothetical protein C7T94_17745 [Pedobacter yulinensis]|uniref:T6SS Phospholipase effector Tle1-like catalytic domain-containing protein n=1 Tax=Pedobacter yulinensis TaxID=2126353 RepID=A0A2T3HH03_9SPHI|nr:DUF2235 domain-containing protein [Pedobacter yulinensis]PST81717.1 hypothetical protein C7T94_17745 [Pedobacter yulinensis]